VDENLSPILAELLRAAGYDVEHVRDVGMKSDPDEAILTYAQSHDRIVVTADTDFGGLLAHTGTVRPSVILLRRLAGRRASEQADHVLRHLSMVEDDLAHGAVVAFDDTRVRVRRLPM